MSSERHTDENPWSAIRGSDPDLVERRVSTAHEQFVERSGGIDTDTGIDFETPHVRPAVLESWQRSQRNGVDPDLEPGVDVFGDSDLRHYRDEHPMAQAMAAVGSLLGDYVSDAPAVVAVTDAEGRVLWLHGHSAVRDLAAGVHFVEGARWSESSAGTNGPGVALHLDRPVVISGAEHFNRRIHAWSCAAAPVHDPVTGRIIGAVDISGGPWVGSPEALALVKATVAAAETQLLQLSGPSGVLARLEVLGHGQPAMRRGTERIQLAQRHAEILLLLADHPEGLSADHLGILLDRAELDSVTIRAEISRLRKVLGETALTSRPYRLLQRIGSDVADVRAALDVGNVATALRLYPGPLLPRSMAPGIEDIRDELRTRIRTAVVNSGDPALLGTWTASVEGRDDRSSWRAYLAALDPNSPLHAQVAARIGLLDRRLGVEATPLQRPVN